MTTRLQGEQCYNIAWIAALHIERAAAIALLDHRHEPPDGFAQHESDKNSYTWGRSGKHNIVIASLPEGMYGTISAATTVTYLVSSLPHLRIGLLVGIGGGIAWPDRDQDIRLGDVVVSCPDRISGGVIQYDIGKTEADGVRELKGSLNMPPQILLHAMASLRAEHEIEPSSIPKILAEMLQNKPHMTRRKTNYTHPGIENDRLFASEYTHTGSSNCDVCDASQEIKRGVRETSDPKIHYGIIASGNTLVWNRARHISS